MQVSDNLRLDDAWPRVPLTSHSLDSFPGVPATGPVLSPYLGNEDGCVSCFVVAKVLAADRSHYPWPHSGLPSSICLPRLSSRPDWPFIRTRTRWDREEITFQPSDKPPRHRSSRARSKRRLRGPIAGLVHSGEAPGMSRWCSCYPYLSQRRRLPPGLRTGGAGETTASIPHLPGTLSQSLKLDLNASILPASFRLDEFRT